MPGYVYIIQSTKNNMYYIGSTLDTNNRLQEHNSGEVKATKNKGPWNLRFSQQYNTIKEARQIEYKLKKLKSRKIIEKIIENQKINLKCS